MYMHVKYTMYNVIQRGVKYRIIQTRAIFPNAIMIKGIA